MKSETLKQLGKMINTIISKGGIQTAISILKNFDKGILDTNIKPSKKPKRTKEKDTASRKQRKRASKPKLKMIARVERLIKQGLPTETIAKKLGISGRSVSAYKANITRRQSK